MERRYNETAFTPEEVDRGAHLDLIKYLLSYNEKAEHRYNDIHITSDGYCIIVQWVDCDYECDDNAKFRFVDEDQCVMTEYRLPDNSTVMCFDKDEVKQTLEDFLKEHPTYKKNEWGVWFDESNCVDLDDLHMEQNENGQ